MTGNNVNLLMRELLPSSGSGISISSSSSSSSNVCIADRKFLWYEMSCKIAAVKMANVNTSSKTAAFYYVSYSHVYNTVRRERDSFILYRTT